MTAPYNTPPSLGREPWMAFFWTLCAPVLFPVVLFAVMGAFITVPAMLGETAPTQSEIRTLWLMTCAASVVHFAVLSFWTDRMGAGAFAGAMRASPIWLLSAVMIGPFILLAPAILVGALMGGDSAFSSDVNMAYFAAENWTLGFLLFVLVLAPLVEEVTFRGVAMGAVLSRGLSPVAAIVISSLAFTIIHMQYNAAGMVVIFLSGVGLAILRVASGTVIVPIIAHMAANANMLFLQTLAEASAQ